MNARVARLMGALTLLLVACGGAGDSDAGLDAGAGDAGDADAGEPTFDGGADGGVTDGGVTDDGGDTDAGPPSPTDAGLCDPSAVRFAFLASGPLEEGTLCDAVFVCVADGAEASRVMAASAEFQCAPTPEAPCPGSTCRYGPGVLDATEIAEICAVTLVSPTPDVVCVVYGP